MIKGARTMLQRPNRGSRFPASHTAFSWLRSTPPPGSHTPFSWEHRFCVQSTPVTHGDDEKEKADMEERSSSSDFLVDIDANFLAEAMTRDGDSVFHVDAAAKACVPVRQFVLPCGTVDDIYPVLQLCEAHHDIIFPCVGVHPFWTKTDQRWPGGRDFTEKSFEQVRQHAHLGQVVAVGECGLDYSDHFPPKQAQLPWFERQVELAAELKKPLFLHERLAFDDVNQILRRYGFVRDSNDAEVPGPVIVHCFTGTREEMLAYIQAGFYIGISGFFLSQRGAYMKEWLKEIPLSRVMLETDAPYMGFKGCRRHPHHAYRKASRSSPNVPSALAVIAEEVAKLYGISTAKLVGITTTNAQKCFGLELCGQLLSQITNAKKQ